MITCGKIFLEYVTHFKLPGSELSPDESFFGVVGGDSGTVSNTQCVRQEAGKIAWGMYN